MTTKKQDRNTTAEPLALASIELGVASRHADDLASLMFVVIDQMERDGQAEDSPAANALSSYAGALRVIARGVAEVAAETSEARDMAERMRAAV